MFLSAMRFIADFHIHSRYSRATSRDLNPETVALWAGKKGITVVGAGDFTHPGWLAELEEKLVEAEEGLYRLKPDLERHACTGPCPSSTGSARFVLSGEISCIYKKDGMTRKVHHLILMPSVDSVRRFNERLARIGNITSDGRPILGLDSRDLLEIALETEERAFLIPAHVWTPWFSVFGSKSGFDDLEACFGDLTGHIHALETGLSSDPPMNRLVSALDPYLLVSNSDAHSPSKLGREANVFDTELSYGAMVRAMTGGPGFVGTVEFYPEEGKYHLDGHRKCHVRLDPRETVERRGLCPACGRALTLGVLHRVAQLADRRSPELTREFFSLIPLTEVLSELMGCGPGSKKVTEHYEQLLEELGPELFILMEAPASELEAAGGRLLAEALDRMRKGRVIREAGYDGEYGAIRLFEKTELRLLAGQMSLFPMRAAGRREKRPVPVPEKAALAVPMPLFDGNPASPLDPVLDPLNAGQRAAVTYAGGHLLVAAGPGTGKTMTLTHRIAYLVREGAARPGQVLALTFTRKAAAEMGRRLDYLVGREAGGELRVSTFHRFCLDVLRTHGRRIGIRPDFILASGVDATALGRRAAEAAGAGGRAVSRFLKALPDLKAAEVVGAVEAQDPGLLPLFARYREMRTDLNFLDLDDLEIETRRLFRSCPEVPGVWGERYPWMFVDEYQDTNAVQVELLKELVRAGARSICAIGDPDQAIYGFRGARVENFLRFGEDFPGAATIRLTRSYRSTGPILQCAASVLEKDNPLEPESPGGVPLFLARCGTGKEEAEMIVEQVERLLGGTSYFSLDSGRVDSRETGAELGFGDLAVLYRLHTQGDAVAEALDRAGIPFVRSGEVPLAARYPANLLRRFLQTFRYPGNAYFRGLYEDTASEEGVLLPAFAPDFGPDGPLLEIVERAAAYHALNDLADDAGEVLKSFRHTAASFGGGLDAFLDYLSLERGIDHALLGGERVALMSLHAAKGLEWPVVFIIGCEDGLIPCTLFGAKDVDEERRLLYVGMTRARRRLTLSHAMRRSLDGRPLQLAPSPFLNLLPPHLTQPLERRVWKPKRPAHEQLSLFE